MLFFVDAYRQMVSLYICICIYRDIYIYIYIGGGVPQSAPDGYRWILPDPARSCRLSAVLRLAFCALHYFCHALYLHQIGKHSAAV